MPFFFNITGWGAEGHLPQTSLRLTADALSCALPRVPHFGGLPRRHRSGSPADTGLVHSYKSQSYTLSVAANKTRSSILLLIVTAMLSNDVLCIA
jgi:hypothetical protein